MGQVELDITADVEAATKFVRGVRRKAIPIAEFRAVNKVAVSVKAAVIPHIHERRRLKKMLIRKNLKILRGIKGHPVARVRASNAPISLKRYGAKLMGRKGKKRVVINVAGQRTVLNHAFMPDKLNGHVFERAGKTRLPIKKMYGPGLGSALLNPRVVKVSRDTVRRRWPVVFPQELSYALSRIKP